MIPPAASVALPFWLEVMVSTLLACSGLLVLTGAVGLLGLKNFFQRMHPVALGATLGAWSACAASAAYFSALQSVPVIHSLLIPILLGITVPITTLLLARAALFRERVAAGDVPPPLANAATGSASTGSAAGAGPPEG